MVATPPVRRSSPGPAAPRAGRSAASGDERCCWTSCPEAVAIAFAARRDRHARTVRRRPPTPSRDRRARPVLVARTAARGVLGRGRARDPQVQPRLGRDRGRADRDHVPDLRGRGVRAVRGLGGPGAMAVGILRGAARSRRNRVAAAPAQHVRGLRRHPRIRVPRDRCDLDAQAFAERGCRARSHTCCAGGVATRVGSAAALGRSVCICHTGAGKRSAPRPPKRPRLSSAG
jgi:hypothetical protein